MWFDKIPKTDPEAKQRVDLIFEKLESAKTTAEVDSLLKLFDRKFKLNDEDYPPIKFKISSAEILHLESVEKLIEKDLITGNNELLDKNPLAKILYAVLWKRNDLKKIKHVIKGIKSGENAGDDDEALTFTQFGRFLADNKEPIIDQHVMRAFSCYQKPAEKIGSLRTLSLLKGKDHVKLINKYKTWLTELKPQLVKKPDYIYHIDKVLFALGKSIKTGKKSNQ
jgi:hypothetical protein